MPGAEESNRVGVWVYGCMGERRTGYPQAKSNATA